MSKLKLPAVPKREPITDKDGALTRPWVLYFEAQNRLAPVEPQVPAPVALPNAPTAVTVAVVDAGESFGLHVAWTLPADTGGTSAYEVQVRYYRDAALTTPDSAWMGLGTPVGATTAAFDNGTWPRPAADQWVIAQVRSVNSDNVFSEWAVSAAAAPLAHATGAGTPGGPPTDPTRLTDTEWSVSVAEYGHNDQTGQAVARIQAVVTATPTDVRYFSAYQFVGPTPPASVTQYVDVCDTARAASGSTTLNWWVNRDRVNAITLQIVMVPSSASSTMFPASSDVVKSVTINPASVPAQVTGFTASVITSLSGCHFKFDWVTPTDLEYFTNNIEGIYCDSGFTPIVGASWWPVFSSVNGFEQGQNDWFAYPANDTYVKFRCKSVSRAGLVNDAAPPTSNVTIPAQGAKDGTNILVNPSFENGMEGWKFYGSQSVVNTSAQHGTHSLKIFGADAVAYQEGIPVAKGDQFSLSAYVRSDAGSGGSAHILVHYLDKTGAFIGYDQADINAAWMIGSAWVLARSPIWTVPDTAVMLRVYPCSTGSDFHGAMYFDNVSLIRVPASEILPAGGDVYFDTTAHNAAIGAAKVTLGKIKPGDMNTTIFADYGISNVTKLADGVVGRVGLFTDGVISSSAKIGSAVILNANIADATVSTAKILDGAITTAKISECSVNKLTAGTATFLGDVTFSRAGSASSVVIGSGGVTINQGIMAITSGLVTVNIDGTNYVKASNSLNQSYTQLNGSGAGAWQTNNSASASVGTTGPYSSLGVLSLQDQYGTTLLIQSASVSFASAGACLLPSNPAGFIMGYWGGSAIRIPYYRS